MSATKDLTLSSTWSITLHDQSSTDQPFTTLGQFNTILGFWELYNSAIIEKNIVEILPPLVNITFYRENTPSKPDNTEQWHGEWNITLHYETNPLQIYQKVVLLVIGEQLTNKIRGLVLQRIPIFNCSGKHINFSISIFTDCKDAQIDLKNILLSHNVIDLNYCINKMAIFYPFKVIHIPMDEQQNSAKISHESEKKESEENNVQTIKYSLNSLMQYSKLVKRANSKYLTQTTNTVQTQTGVKLDASPNNILKDLVLKLFSKHRNSYLLTVTSRTDMISDNLQKDILSAEGCIICMQTSLKSPYDKPQKQANPSESDEKSYSPLSEKSQNQKNESNSFIIAQCLGLGCQHIIHCDCILSAHDSISMRDKHCSNFFATIDLSHLTNMQIQTEIGYHINTENVTGKFYFFSFKVNHLISDQTSVSPNWPINVPSYYQIKSNGAKQECLQIFFEQTELQMRRGTIQIAIVSTNTNNKHQNIFMHNANFEIDLQNNNNKIYQIRYVDVSTQNVLIINIKLRKENSSLHIISLRYELNSNNISLTTVKPVNNTLSFPLICENNIDSAPTVTSMSPSPYVGSSPSTFQSMPLSVPLTLSMANINNVIAAPISINTVNNNIIMLQNSAAHNSNNKSVTNTSLTSASLVPPSLHLVENMSHKFNNPQQLYYYACSQLGSKYITTKIRNPVYFAIFFEKLKSFFPLLMINCTGHTVCRAMYSQVHCTLSDKLILLNSLISNFSKIASNRQGSFALICIMSSITSNKEIEIIKKGFTSIIKQGNNELFDNIILSQSGYHVIKKFIGFGFPYFSCILDGISFDFTKYATHHYGVPIIRSILDMISTNESLISEQHLNHLKLFAEHTNDLVCNQYGNYVVQQILEISPVSIADVIKKLMVTKYSHYAKHKFASNVVEKCLKHGLKSDTNGNECQEIQGENCWSPIIIRELLCDAKILIDHRYGNYCLQTALSVCIESKSQMKNGDQLLKEFLDTTRPFLHLLRLNVRKKWQKLLFSAANTNLVFSND